MAFCKQERLAAVAEPKNRRWHPTFGGNHQAAKRITDNGGNIPRVSAVYCTMGENILSCLFL